MKKTILLILAGISLFGCGDVYEPIGPDSYPPSNPKSYIQGFYELEDINVFPFGNIQIDKEKREIRDNGNFDPPKLYNVPDGIGLHVSIGTLGIGKGFITYGTRDANQEYYDQLVAEIGDINYNSNIMDGLSPGGIVANADQISAIEVTCNQDINDKYPKGTSLNDIFSVYFEDPYAVIKNGYRSLTGAPYYKLFGLRQGLPYAFYGNKLSSVDFPSKPHIGVVIYLILEEPPVETGLYEFTVSIKETKGKEVKKTAVGIKIQGAKL